MSPPTPDRFVTTIECRASQHSYGDAGRNARKRSARGHSGRPRRTGAATPNARSEESDDQERRRRIERQLWLVRIALVSAKTELVNSVDYDALRVAIVSGVARIELTALDPTRIEDVAWSGGRPHLENVATQLQRVATGEVEYLVVRAAGHAVSKGGIDFAREPGAGTIWQVATHPHLEGLGLATRLIHELESRALRRGANRLRLAVELDNARAQRLYERLGYGATGESDASWEAEAADGSRFLYTTKLTEMVKVV